ncbi:hypothetical protein SLEP1_g24923 [Rubroshorea leprosula]|uniref:Uncharacterized protein n=1 Tax=Rubroshorea leprosula TaxID=152421 RepID=A0AAV5JNE1_9ROSI|nr:hypothetical protein SLEP1_g24923 [Rubroshorea leprosula]
MLLAANILEYKFILSLGLTCEDLIGEEIWSSKDKKGRT